MPTVAVKCPLKVGCEQKEALGLFHVFLHHPVIIFPKGELIQQS